MRYARALTAGEAAALLVRLQHGGVGAAGIARLIALRIRWCSHDPELDGFRPDSRTKFARWLAQHGRIVG